MDCLGIQLFCLQYSSLFSLWPDRRMFPLYPRLTEASDERPQQGEGSIPPTHLRGWGKCMQAKVGLDVHKVYLMGGVGLHRCFAGGGARGKGEKGSCRKLQEATGS